MRIFADTNITAPAVQALRAAGHDVVYSAERAHDPGDADLLEEAAAEKRIFITKDHDIGALVFRDGAKHAGVLLIDDLGDAHEEAALLRSALSQIEAEAQTHGFYRAGSAGLRRVSPQ